MYKIPTTLACHFVSAVMATSVLVACSIKPLDEEVCPEPIAEQISAFSEPEIIPLETALGTLESFLNETEGEMCATKGGRSREISSIETHFSSSSLTKSGEGLPDAYFVNFSDESGFAVLGANTDIAPIVAVTEEGILTPEDIDNYDQEESSLLYVDGEVCYSMSPRIYVSGVVRNALTAKIAKDDKIDGNDSYRTATPVVSRPSVAPLLKTKWDQGQYASKTATKINLYNKHCFYEDLGGYALAGCCIIAATQVMAYNYSKMNNDVVNLNGHVFDFKVMTSRADINSLSRSDGEKCSEFIGYVFDNMKKLSVNETGTGSNRNYVRNFLRDYAVHFYNNFINSYSKCFTDSMFDTTKAMLDEGKPIIVGGQTSNDGHCWVIDGYKYNSEELVLHCNWGWGGSFDGYFSRTCFHPKKAIEYDGRSYNSTVTEFYKDFYTITYDIQ